MERYGACGCRAVKYSSLPKSMIVNIEDGLAKIVIDPYSGRVEGVHVLAPNSSEFIVQASLYIKHGYRVEDVIDVVQAFPTSAEILKLASQAFIRRVDLQPCCVE